MKPTGFAFSTDYCLPMSDRYDLRKKMKTFRPRKKVLYKGYRKRKHILSSKSKSLCRRNKDSQNSEPSCSESLTDNSYVNEKLLEINNCFCCRVSSKSVEQLDMGKNFETNRSPCQNCFKTQLEKKNEFSKGLDFVTSALHRSFDRNQLVSNEKFGSTGSDQDLKNLKYKLCGEKINHTTPVSNRFRTFAAVESRKRKRSVKSKSFEENSLDVNGDLIISDHTTPVSNRLRTSAAVESRKRKRSVKSKSSEGNSLDVNGDLIISEMCCSINSSGVKKVKNKEQLHQKYTPIKSASRSLKDIDSFFSQHSPITHSPFTVMQTRSKKMESSKNYFESSNSKIVLNAEICDIILTPPQPLEF